MIKSRYYQVLYIVASLTAFVLSFLLKRIVKSAGKKNVWTSAIEGCM